MHLQSCRKLRQQPYLVTDTKELVEVEKMMPRPWEVTMTTSMMANSQIINLDVNTLELLGTSNSSSPCRFSFWQDLTAEGLKSQVVSDFEFKEVIESEKQPQGMVPGIHSDCHISMFPTTKSPRSQSSLLSSQCISSRNMAPF
jgi:hypothetical protein